MSGRKLLWAGLGLLLFWQALAMIVNQDILPPPWLVLLEFFNEIQGDLGWHFAASLWRVLASMLLSIALAAPAGLLLGQSKRLNDLLSPVIYLLYPVPKVVLVPVVLLFLGINDTSKIAIIFLILFFQVLVLVRDQAASITPELLYSVRPLGIELPIQPVKREVYNFSYHGDLQGVFYPLTAFPSGVYIYQENETNFMCGKSLEDDPVTFDLSSNRKKFMDLIWPDLVAYVPAFDRIKLNNGWAGLYAVNTFDGNAFIGAWPGLKGLLLANGFSGHGFQQSHAVGRYLSEMILGQEHAIDLAIFSPQRLLDNAPVFEGHGKLV